MTQTDQRDITRYGPLGARLPRIQLAHSCLF